MTHSALATRTSVPYAMNQPGGHSQLVAAAASGSLPALGGLYEAHSGRVFSIAYRLTASRHDAEDILQDVFVGLPRALRGYTEQGRFEQWLGRLATRTALMHLRAHRRKREDELDELTHTELAAPSADPADPVLL